MVYVCVKPWEFRALENIHFEPDCMYLRLKKSSKKQQYADIYLLLSYSTSFGYPSRP